MRKAGVLLPAAGRRVSPKLQLQQGGEGPCWAARRKEEKFWFTYHRLFPFFAQISLNYVFPCLLFVTGSVVGVLKWLSLNVTSRMLTFPVCLFSSQKAESTLERSWSQQCLLCASSPSLPWEDFFDHTLSSSDASRDQHPTVQKVASQETVTATE